MKFIWIALINFVLSAFTMGPWIYIADSSLGWTTAGLSFLAACMWLWIICREAVKP